MPKLESVLLADFDIGAPLQARIDVALKRVRIRRQLAPVRRRLRLRMRAAALFFLPFYRAAQARVTFRPGVQARKEPRNRLQRRLRRRQEQLQQLEQQQQQQQNLVATTSHR